MRQPFSSDALPAGQRVVLALEYVGTDACGWQHQAHTSRPSIQQQLEDALAIVADGGIRCHCAGRTDAGVHATHQIVHFDPEVSRSPKAWVLGTNMHLPDSIAVKWAQGVDGDFHARFSAVRRRYRYIIHNCEHRPAIGSGLLLWHRQSLNESSMHEAAQQLLGEQDFSSFRASGCQSRTPMRRVDAISVTRQGPLVVIEIVANAFLHHMVRNITGALIEVGLGRESLAWMGELLACRDRTLGAATARPDGLYLVDVEYPERYGLPANYSPGPLFVN